MINAQAIRPQFSLWGIKQVKATQKIIPSQTLIIWSGETIQASRGRDKAYETNKSHLKQITDLDDFHMVLNNPTPKGKELVNLNTHREHLLRA